MKLTKRYFNNKNKTFTTLVIVNLDIILQSLNCQLLRGKVGYVKVIPCNTHFNEIQVISDPGILSAKRDWLILCIILIIPGKYNQFINYALFSWPMQKIKTTILVHFLLLQLNTTGWLIHKK